LTLYVTVKRMSTALLLITGTPPSAFDGLPSTPIKGKQK
jgi:hypothetical protein